MTSGISTLKFSNLCEKGILLGEHRPREELQPLRMYHSSVGHAITIIFTFVQLSAFLIARLAMTASMSAETWEDKLSAHTLDCHCVC